MKKLYTMLMSAACLFAATAATATAANPQKTITLPVTNAKLIESGVSQSAQDASRVVCKEFNPASRTSSNVSTKGFVDLDINPWKSIGTGTWAEGPLDYYSDINAGDQWQVEIEEHQTNKGFYRIIPYNENSPLAELMGSADSTYIYIHAEDPTKVYTTGGESDASTRENNDWYTAFYGGFYVSFYGPEAGWNNENPGYGTLADNVISFPANSHALYTQSGWVLTNKGGKFKIFLPGAEVKDYAFETESEVCSQENVVYFQATKAGADVANVYCNIFSGAYSDGVVEQVYGMVKGDDSKKIQVGQAYNFSNTTTYGVYTIFMIATDADDNLVEGQLHHVFMINDDSANWTSLGEGTFNDPILVDAQYGAQGQTEPFEIPVEVQVNNDNPGYFRIVNPYDALLGEDAVVHEGHNHYIYFNCTDPDAVKIEYNPVGFDGGYGAMSCRSVSDRYSSYTAAELEGYGYGTIKYDAENHIINIPAKSIFYAEKNYMKNQFFVSQLAGSLTIPELASINDLLDDNSDAPVEYFNLQGVQVENPTAGVYIARKGSKVAKVFVK